MRSGDLEPGSAGVPDLVEFWSACDLSSPPFAHPDDRSALDLGADAREQSLIGFEDFVAGPRFGDYGDQHFHLSLLPVPYAGDLARAEIFLLQLNPGFSLSDYHELRAPSFKRRLERNLRQELDGEEFPFLFLDPEFC